MKKINLPSLFLMTLVSFMACNGLDDSEYKVVKELACSNSEYNVSEDESIVTIPFYSNGDVTLRYLNDSNSWASINGNHFTGDDTLKVSVSANDGFRRMAKLELSLNGGEKLDTIYIRQSGEVAYIECQMPYTTVDGSKDDVASYNFNTNLNFSDFSQNTYYNSGNSGWVKSTTSSDGKILVSTSPTQSDHISKANISLNFIDGWEEELVLDLFITASDKNGKFGTLISWEQARNLAGKGTITEDYYIDAVVISDYNSRNMALNPSISFDEVDVTESERTAYVQNSDGSQGFCLKYIDSKDNLLSRGTAVSISLLGLNIEKEIDPDRYYILNLKADCIVKSTKGTIVDKFKMIDEINDSDIFTFVKLVETEIYCKYGAYTNVHEDYVLSSSINEMCSGNKNRFDGWATMLIDAEGAAIYAPVNMLCLWRRSTDATISTLVPQGTGITEGIIVSEINSRYGDMGRYQIRVIDESGFAQNREAQSAYTEYVRYNGQPYSYRYGQYAAINSKYAAPSGLEARMRQIIPSDDISQQKQTPNAELSCQNYMAAASLTDSNYPLASNDSYCSPFCTNDNIGKSGIASTRNDSGHPRALIMIHDIKGWFDWSENKVSGYRGIVLETSTKEIQGNVMTLAFAFSAGKLSASTSSNFPAHWCVEYSIDGGKTFSICPDAITGKDFVHLRSLPWMDGTIRGTKYFSSGSCGLGATEHCFKIPSNAFGIENLIIRIRPYDDTMSGLTIDWDGNPENGKVSSNTIVDTYINFEYISLRYR